VLNNRIGVVDVLIGLPDFFFQAEDGIRDYKVTGVQTCALPISPSCTASMTFASPPSVVIITTGMLLNAGFAFNALRSSIPSMLGMLTSVRTKFTVSVFTFS